MIGTTNGTAVKVGTPVPTTTTGGTGAESPCSVNVRAMIRGYDCQLTFRGPTGSYVLTRLLAALEWVETTGGGPAARPGKAARSAATDGPTGPKCPVHGSPMRLGQHGYYCPRKTAPGDYCRERHP